MPWVRIDDHFDEHPKMQRVGPLGWGVWLAGLAYCNRNLTDGFIPWAKARTLCSFGVVEDDGKVWDLSRSSGYAGDDIDSEWVIGLLIDAGLWEEVQNGRGRIDGYRIHDYDDYQPTKAQIEEEREAKRRAGQAGGQASAQARAQAESKRAVSNRSTELVAESNPVPNPVPVPNPSVSDETEEAATREADVEFSPAERKVVSNIKHVPGMAAVADIAVAAHLREIVQNRGSPVSESALVTDSMNFRDHWTEQRKRRPRGERWSDRGWKKAMTNWFSRTNESVKTRDGRREETRDDHKRRHMEKYGHWFEPNEG